MQLLTTVDPRDNLQKATRFELIEYAKANGVDVPEDAPGSYTIQLLRARNLTNIKIPDRPLGLYVAPSNSFTDAPQGIDADEHLIKQYTQQKKIETEVSQMSIQEIRRFCKANNIKFSRKDTLVILREKLSG